MTILDQYEEHDWNDLPQWVRESATVLGYTPELWDEDGAEPPSEEKSEQSVRIRTHDLVITWCALNHCAAATAQVFDANEFRQKATSVTVLASKATSTRRGNFQGPDGPFIRATRVRILSVKINQGCPILSKYDFRLRVFFAEILRQPRFCKTVQKSDREESSETKNRIWIPIDFASNGTETFSVIDEKTASETIEKFASSWDWSQLNRNRASERKLKIWDDRAVVVAQR